MLMMVMSGEIVLMITSQGMTVVLNKMRRSVFSSAGGNSILMSGQLIKNMDEFMKVASAFATVNGF